MYNVIAMWLRLSFLICIVTLCAAAQDALFLLEALAIEGSTVPQSAIVEISGMALTNPINKADIEKACVALQESGLFSQIAYRYAPGPKNGYVVTLTLEDASPLVAAEIDVPGVDSDAAWQWLASKFGRFNRRVPQSGAAQAILGKQIAQRLGSAVTGKALTTLLESDASGKMTVSFQPESLPVIQSVSFAGNQSVPASELAAALDKPLSGARFIARRIDGAVEMNLRPAYERHGFYRAKFAPAAAVITGDSVSLGVTITEGATYNLGNVEFVGADLPIKEMLSAAKLPTGKLANWLQIQQGMWEMERVVKKTGYFQASIASERTLDDAARVLHLKLPVAKGALFHFGEVRFTGLSANSEALARRTWRAKAGDPYDYTYSNEFLNAFSRVADLSNVKLDVVEKPGAGSNVIDVTIAFLQK